MKKVLALLLLRANQVVGLDTFIEELWGDKSPQTAITTTQTYVYHLRRSLGRAVGADRAEDIIRTAAPGYVLTADDNDIDIPQFDSLITRAQLAATAEDFRESARQAKKALSLWTGAPLAGVDRGNILRGYAVNLEERHIAALELRLQAEMRLGNHREIIGELRSLVTVHPLNEWFHSQLITALHKAGRRSEALDAYQNVRDLLRLELGLEPSPELWHLHQEILAADSRVRPPHNRLPLAQRSGIRRSAPVL